MTVDREQTRRDAETHDPECASLHRSHDPGPEGKGHFDERGWYYGECDCCASSSPRKGMERSSC